MSFQRELMPGETLLCKSGLHWVRFLPPLGLMIGAFAAQPHIGNYANWIKLAAVLYAFVVLLRKLTTHVWVTNRRVVMRWGILARRTEDMAIPEIESISLDENLIARIFGFGTFTLRGTGGSLPPVRYIGNPATIRQTIYQQKGTQPERSTRPAAVQTAPPIATQQPPAPVPPEDTTSAARLQRLEHKQSDLARRLERLERIFRTNIQNGEPADSQRFVEPETH